ncbi:hypothetical protein [Neobacillus muris]|uniref:hypothetical protein n=1 Tax=Neobacillus muris TaxID=2941334 RepID=UPI00203D8EA6|nr:hypothetical protein [Neobacillus muris]
MKELFGMNGRRLLIHPAKAPQQLTVTVERFGGLSQQVRINFLKNWFVFVVWSTSDDSRHFMNLPLVQPGNLEEFKSELYSINVWDWEPAYQREDGIILDGKYWSVELRTKEKVYKFEGAESFPKNWPLFCKTIEKLVGTPFGL